MRAVNPPPWLPVVWEYIGEAVPLYMSDNYAVSFSNGRWNVFDVYTLQVFLVSHTLDTRYHPVTVGRNWCAVRDGGLVNQQTNLKFEHTFESNSSANPMSMLELGIDFFVSIKVSRPVWFICPMTNRVWHSGTKKDKETLQPGKRYCHMCMECFSANNFVSQHLKTMHDR
jgi:hypothetical protein